MCPSASSRWCPTPDQLMILEEMYKAGVRTPSASQIQKITAQLALYGKIEGKNVFYWFQNHKARDRQKLRRKLSKQLQLQQQIFQQQFPVSSFLHGYVDLSPSVSSSTSIPPLAYYSNAPNLPAADSYINIPREGEHLLMLHNWKSNDTMDKEINRTMKMYSGGWMMVEEKDMDSPACRATRPVETLQLFPTTCTNLKEDPGRPRLSCHNEAAEPN